MHAAQTADRRLSIPRVAAALAGLAFLALVLPYLLVSSLHERRLDRADQQLTSIVASLRGAANPSTAQVLTGRGNPPRVQDDGWTAAASSPLSRAVSDPGPDPWGNAYLVIARDGRWATAISAGPDGMLQTRFGSTSPSGDDRVQPVR